MLKAAWLSAKISDAPFIMILSWVVDTYDYYWDDDIEERHYFIIPVETKAEAYSYQADIPDSEMRIIRVKRYPYQLSFKRKISKTKKHALIMGNGVDYSKI